MRNLGLLFSVRNGKLQKYIISSMPNVHDYFMESIDDDFTKIKFLGSSVVTDYFQSFCDRKACGHEYNLDQDLRYRILEGSIQ